MINIYLRENSEEGMIRRAITEYLGEKVENEEIRIVDDVKDADLFVTDSGIQDFLWQMEGKRHVLIRNSDKYEFIDCSLMEDGYIWLVVSTENGYLLNKLSFAGDESKTFVIPGNVKRDNRVFSNILHFNNKLYLLPQFDNKIRIFALDTKVWKVIDIPNQQGEKALFSTAFMYKNEIFIMPWNYSRIAVLDAQTDEMRMEEIDNPDTSYVHSPYCKKGWLIKNDYVFYSDSSKAILSLDPETLKVNKLKDSPVKTRRISEKIDNRIYLLGGKKIWIYDLESKKMIEKDPGGTNVFGNKEGFDDCVLTGDKIYLFPARSQAVARLDTKTMSLKSCAELSNPKWEKFANRLKCRCAGVCGNTISACDILGIEVIKFDGKNIEKIRPDICKIAVAVQKIANAVMAPNIEDELYRRE